MPLSPFLRMALILGLISAIGPFAIDMYLPALPAIGASLRADVGAVQWSLTAFFLALGVGQLVYGPVSDMVGRRPPLFFGLGLFTLASVGIGLAISAFSANMQQAMLYTFLLAQGGASHGASLCGVAFTFAFRGLAIHFGWQMPKWLTLRH